MISLIRRGDLFLENYLKVWLVMSLITLIIYGIDKAKAADGKKRIPEITLLTLAALGGAPGAFLGRIFFNHKRNALSKMHFTIIIYLSLAFQISMCLFFVIMRYKGVNL